MIATQYFFELDTNKDGKVDKTEFINGNIRLQKLYKYEVTNSHRLGDIFDEIDTDHDHSISIIECRKWLLNQVRGKKSPNDKLIRVLATLSFKMIDADKDGSISAKEFLTAVKKFVKNSNKEDKLQVPTDETMNRLYKNADLHHDSKHFDIDDYINLIRIALTHKHSATTNY